MNRNNQITSLLEIFLVSSKLGLTSFGEKKKVDQ